MHDSFRSTSLPPQLGQRLTLAIESEEDHTHQFKIGPLQNSGANSKMRTIDEIFSSTNNIIDAIITEEGNSDERSKTLSRFLDMTECQKLKIQYAISFLRVSKQLDELRMVLSVNSSQPVNLQENAKELNRWGCVDRATRLYNQISADQIKFCNWISLVDEKASSFHKTKDTLNNDQSLFAEVLCDFNCDKGLINKLEIVKIIKIEDNKALITGCAYSTMRQFGHNFGLYNTLKSSIEQEHQSLGECGLKCNSCLEKIQISEDEKDVAKIGQQVRTWIPLIYLQPLGMEAKLMEKVRIARQLILSTWESRMKEAAQAILNLLCSTFKHWNRDKIDVDYGAISEDIKRSLSRFFASLEVSLKNDRECEAHYDLILQQLRSLQSGNGAEGPLSQFGVQEEASNESRNERIGQLMLEHRIIFRLLEKYEEILQTLEAANEGSSKLHFGFASQSDGCFGRSNDVLEQSSGIEASELKGAGMAAPLDASVGMAAGEFETSLKCTASETSLLSPPPPFNKPPGLLCPRVLSLSKKWKTAEEGMEKLYDSEPCILEATTHQRHQTHSGRYRSMDLSIKNLDKCSRIRARSFGQGSKPLPRTSYPLPVMTSSPPTKPTAVNPVNGDNAGHDETGYVVIMRPSFRERITVVLDTRRRKRISIHTAIERGIAGFQMDTSVEQKTEEQMNEDDQKRHFFVYDTARGIKLDFSHAIEAGIVHYDSSATENIVFDEYAKSEWRGVKSIYHPLVYRVEQVRRVIERGGKLIRQKLNWLSFHQAIRTGRLDRVTGEYVVHSGDSEDAWGEKEKEEVVLRLPFSKALAYGLVKVVPLRHCLIEKLPRDKCIFT